MVGPGKSAGCGAAELMKAASRRRK